MIVRLRRGLLLIGLLAAVFAARPASASLTAAQLAAVGLKPPPGAALPLDVLLTGLDGRSATLRRVLDGRPGVVVFTDYLCTQLCSPILAVTAAALGASGLTAGRDYRLIPIGFNRRASAEDARKMIEAQIGFKSTVGRATFPLMAADKSFRELANAVGYTFAYDAQDARYAHPAALLVVASDGRLTRVLSGLSITGQDATQALQEAAGGGGASAAFNRIRLLCYGLGAEIGRYTNMARLLLMSGGAATLIILAAALVAFSRLNARGRR